MSSGYLKSAISEIYSEKDDFIIIGLTGRTGSGCSTVASILAKESKEIRHSLYSGNSPQYNEQRKEKIINKRFNQSWQSFILIQVSTIIILKLSELGSDSIRAFLEKENLKEDTVNEIVGITSEIHDKYKSIDREKFESIVLFFSKTLPEQNSKIRAALGKASFVKVFQKIGINLRKSGRADSDNIVNESFNTVSKEINTIIRLIRKTRNKGEKTFLVIDAIRNQFEATFFQDRYSAFYLMAVSCNDDERKARLRKMGYTDMDINQLDDNEYPKKNVRLDSPDAYIKQDIESCLQRADLYIDNPQSKNIVSDYCYLANQLIKFVTLMIHPGIITPTPLERCMQFAYTAKINSGCISRQVGAVITDENFSIKAVGWNDTPEGQVPCVLRDRFDLQNGTDQTAYSDFEKNDEGFLSSLGEKNKVFKFILDSGRNASYCFKTEYHNLTKEKNQVHTRSLHAEENAFLQLSKYGGSGIKGGKLFTTASPCELCSKKAYQLGIKEIYYIDPYPGIAIKNILMSGSKSPELIIFKGAIGRAFHNLYTPKLAYKDELCTLIDK